MGQAEHKRRAVLLWSPCVANRGREVHASRSTSLRAASMSRADHSCTIDAIRLKSRNSTRRASPRLSANPPRRRNAPASRPRRHRPQSSSASRRTASQAGFFILTQSGERPLR